MGRGGLFLNAFLENDVVRSYFFGITEIAASTHQVRGRSQGRRGGSLGRWLPRLPDSFGYRFAITVMTAAGFPSVDAGEVEHGADVLLIF
jgi:hypothetical protein